MPNFQDYVQLASDTLRHAGEAVIVGSGPGAKTFGFSNDLGSLGLAANPTGLRQVSIPDADGTLVMRSEVLLGISAGTTRITSGEVVMADANGISFGANGQTVTASVAAGATATGNLGAIAAGTQTGTSGTVVFSDSNNVTFGMSGSTRITASIPAGATATGNLGAIAAGTQTATSGTIVLSDSNGISFGMSGSTRVTASMDAIRQVVAGTRTATGSRISFSDVNGVSFGVQTNDSVLTASVAAGATATGNLGGLAAGTQTATSGTIVFSDSNGISFGMSGSTRVTATYTQSTQFLAITLGGNTAGTTTFNASNNATIFLHGGPNVTLSGNGSTITVSAAGGAGGGGGTISCYPRDGDVYGWVNTAPLHTGASGATGGSTQFTASAYVWPFPLEAQLNFQFLHVMFSQAATSAGTGSATVGLMLGFYTLDQNTRLSLYKSYHWGMYMSQNSISARSHTWFWGTNSTSNTSVLNGNVSASFTGQRQILLNATNDTLPASQYYVALMVTQRSSNANVFGVGSYGIVTASQTTGGSMIGTNALQSQWPPSNAGIFSTTTNTNVIIVGLLMPNSIATSAITGTGGTSQWRVPYFRAFAVST